MTYQQPQGNNTNLQGDNQAALLERTQSLTNQINEMTYQQPQGNNTNLQGDNMPATIEPTAPDNQAADVAANGAGESTPEDTQTAQQQIINQQNETIAALLERTQSLTNQINELIRNGAAINDGNSTQPQASTTSLADDYIPLKDLGAEIGKRD